jgi:hypothetical protein
MALLARCGDNLHVMLKKATVDLNSVFKKQAGKDKEKAD